jgi:hypothetical protein
MSREATPVLVRQPGAQAPRRESAWPLVGAGRKGRP